MITSEPQLYRTIKVLVEKGDKAKEKANQTYPPACAYPEEGKCYQ